MKTAEYVGQQIEQMKAGGMPFQEVAWKAALLCVGWAYVYGARGQYCTPANRRARYSDEHPTIKTKCKNFNGSGSAGCDGCKWYPDSKYTRFFDCRGFTYWILKQVYNGWELEGAGATSQWNTEKNWRVKGTIDQMPRDTLVCLFVKKGAKMEHTGFGFNDETVECSAGVQHFTSRNKKWTHFGVPACIDGDIPGPDPEYRPTLRRGDKGPYVTLAQTQLFTKGYDLGKCGIDGDFGKATEAAVKKFQTDSGLTADGIIGAATWKALESQEPTGSLYTVTIPHLGKSKAEELIRHYDGAVMEEERG